MLCHWGHALVVPHASYALAAVDHGRARLPVHLWCVPITQRERMVAREREVVAARQRLVLAGASAEMDWRDTAPGHRSSHHPPGAAASRPAGAATATHAAGAPAAGGDRTSKRILAEARAQMEAAALDEGRADAMRRQNAGAWDAVLGAWGSPQSGSSGGDGVGGSGGGYGVSGGNFGGSPQGAGSSSNNISNTSAASHVPLLVC